MRTVSIRAALCMILTLALAVPVATAEAPAAGADVLDHMLADGWEIVTPHVLEKVYDDGRVRTLAFGRAGLEWEAARLTLEVERMEGIVAETGHPEDREALASLRGALADLEIEIQGMPPAAETPDLQRVVGTLGCTLQISRSAVAAPTSTGPMASASASFSDTCATYGCVYAHAYARGYYGSLYRTYSETDPEHCAYYGASASAYASVEANNNCYSYAYARVKVQDSLGSWSTFTDSATNYLCVPPPPPLTVYIDGPTSVTNCATYFWRAVTNRPADVYQWKRDGVVVGSGLRYEGYVCTADEPSITLTVTVSDDTSSDSDNHYVSVDVTPIDPPDKCEDPTEILCPPEQL